MTRVPAGSKTARLFFALWPDEGVRAALAAIAEACRAECGGRPIPAENIHLTLAFLGEVNVGRISELTMVADAIRAPSFALVLDTRGYWRHNRIAWMGTRETPEGLRALAGDFSRALRARGLRSDTRDYTPHITLLRDAKRPPSSPQPAAISWAVKEFVLVRSRSGRQSSAYEVMTRWPLESV